MVDKDNGSSPSTRGTSTANIPRELHALARSAVRLVRQKTGRPYSLIQFTNEAFGRQIKEIQDTYNDGKPIVPDGTPLDRGRPT